MTEPHNSFCSNVDMCVEDDFGTVKHKVRAALEALGVANVLLADLNEEYKEEKKEMEAVIQALRDECEILRKERDMVKADLARARLTNFTRQ